MKKYILSSLVAALLPIILFAQESPALPFLRIDRSAITSAMGGADALSPLYNPAAVPFRGSDVAFSYQGWAPGGVKSTNLNLLGVIRAGKRIGIHFLGAYQQGKEYIQYDHMGAGKATFDPLDLVVGAGLGFAFTDFLSFGLNVKFAQSSIAPETKISAISGDAFVMFSRKGFNSTVGVASLGTPVKSGDASFGLPTSAKVGVGYDAKFGTSAIFVEADADIFFIGGVGAALGTQYGWNDMVFVRAGFHLGTGQCPLPTYASVGLGGKFMGIHIDVSYLLANRALANTLCVGLGYSF